MLTINFLLPYAHQQQSLSDWMSLLGFITGFISLVVTLYNEYKKKHKLEIHFTEDNYFFDKLYMYKTSIGNTQGLIRMRLINKSISPLTVYDITIKNKGNDITWTCPEENSIRIKDPKTVHKFEQNSTLFDITSKYKLPLRIQEYDVFDGFIFLGSLETSNQNDIYFDITINTSAKQFKTKCKLSHISKVDFDSVKLQIKID